jgi:hypothetical protein
MFAGFLQLSTIAREAVPPLMVVTPWPAIVRPHAILVIIFAAALKVFELSDGVSQNVSGFSTRQAPNSHFHASI